MHVFCGRMLKRGDMAAIHAISTMYLRGDRKDVDVHVYLDPTLGSRIIQWYMVSELSLNT
jgi:hypothetical protein